MAENVTSEGYCIEDVPEICSLDQYNFKKARLKASLAWIAHKAFQYPETAVPEDMLVPFFKDERGLDNLKPSVIYQLASGELYSLACSKIFPPSIHPWNGHAAVIHGLSRRGVYVLDGNEPVSEVILAQTQKIRLSSHVAMIDAIMKAYATEVVSIEAVVKAVRQITTFNASSELPFDLEDALLFWMNKVCAATQHRLDRERRAHQEGLLNMSPKSVKLRKDQLQPKSLATIPVMEDLMKDLSDGCCLAVVICHYCPHLLRFEDISFRETMSFADCLHNIQVITTFFKSFMPGTFHYTLEDILYTHTSIKNNIIAFIAEIFHTFEVSKPEHLGVGRSRAENILAANTSKVAQIMSSIPISGVTKRSFQVGGASPKHDLTRTPGMQEDGFQHGSPGSQSRLLPNRRQNRSSLVLDSSSQSKEVANLRRSNSWDDLHTHKPLPAWMSPERSSTTPDVHGSHTGSLLANVSIDTYVNESRLFDHDLGISQDTHSSMSIHGSIAQSQDPRSIHGSVAQSQDPRSIHGSMTESQDPRIPTNLDGDQEDLEVQSLTSISNISRDQRSASARDPQYDRGDGYGVSTQMNFQRPLSEHFHSSQSQRDTSSYRSNVINPVDLPPAGLSMSEATRKKMRLDISPVELRSQSLSASRDRLMPSQGRPLKERNHTASKGMESGEYGMRRSPNSRRCSSSSDPPGGLPPGQRNPKTKKQDLPRV